MSNLTEQLKKLMPFFGDVDVKKPKDSSKISIGRIIKYNEDQPRDSHGRFGSNDTSGETRASVRGYAERLAVKLVAEAKKNEPAITKAVNKAITSNAGTRVRPDTSVKTEISLARKLLEDKPMSNARVARIASKTGDVVRYTGVFPEKTMAANVGKALESLKAAGYEEVRTKNYFNNDPQNGYRGINSIFLDPKTGQKFEVQFHTEKSLSTAEAQHKVYDIAREFPVGSSQREQARVSMIDAFSRVPIPKGISSIGEYYVKKFVL